MRIALVTPYDAGFPSGVNSHVANLARELTRAGHEVQCFAPGVRPGELPAGTRLMGRAIPLPIAGSLARVTLSPLTSRRARRALADGQFEIVHIHEPFVPALSLAFLRQSRAPTVGTFHAAHEGPSMPYLVGGPLVRRWARQLHGRIAVSPAAARLAQRHVPGQYEMIPNGVDLEHFSRPMPCLPGLAALQPYVLFVGRFEERKGLPVLVEAFREVRAAHPEVRLLVVGDGHATMERALGADQPPGVHLVGNVPLELLPMYYQHAAVFCAPNTGNESFGVVLLEAMAAGCPLVASNIEGFAELVAYGAHGLLVPPRNPTLLADAISRVLSDSAMARELAAGGAAYVEQFAWPHVAAEIVRFYERTLGKAEPA